jgi:hypothetical protein
LRYHYAVCGMVLAADESIPHLSSLAIPEPASMHAVPRKTRTASRSSHYATLYDGPYIIAGREAPVTSHRVDGGIEVASDNCRFLVSSDGALIESIGGTRCADLELLIGPVLVLALALNGRFCLHTSAIVMNGAAVCFLGDSGAGKSTIAATLADIDTGIQHAVDDIGCLTMRRELMLNKGFPQPRTPSLASPWAADIPVRALVTLRFADPGTEPILYRQSTRQTWSELVKGTVAARLFDSELLTAHLAFAATAAAAVEGFTLDYPKRADVFGELRELLSRL